MKQRWRQIAAGVLLSVFFLYLAVRGEDWDAIGDAVAETDPTFVVLMAFVGALALLVRALRWKVLLELATGRSLPLAPVFSATAIGFMANMVLPLRIGEIARPYLVSRHTRVGLSTALATVVLERVLDLLVLFSFALVVVTLADVPTAVTSMTWIAGGLVAVLWLGLIVIHHRRQRLVPKLDRLWLKLPESIGARIVRIEHEFLDAITIVADVAVFIRTVVWSLLTWLLIALGFSLGFPALDIAVPFLMGGISVATIVALAVSVPGAPGFLGQFEWGCKLALTDVYGIAGAAALAYSFVVHAVQWAVQVVIGLVYLIREGLSLGELERISVESEPAA